MRSLRKVRVVALVLAGIAAAAPVSAQQIVVDRGRAAGKYWLFPIAADPHSYLYAIAQAHLARHPNGKPQFSFLRFVENVMSEGGSTSLVEATGGGIVHAVVELGVAEDQRKQALTDAQRALQQIDPAGKIVGAASYTSGQFMLVTSFQEEDSKGKTGAAAAGSAGKWVEKVVSIGEAPILEGGKAAISMRLTKDGAKILWQSFHTATPDISFVFKMHVEGVKSPIEAKVKVDWERAYSSQKIQVGVAAPMTQIDVDLAFEELRQQGVIKLTEIGDDAEMHTLVQETYNKVRDLMFDENKGLMAGKPIDVGDSGGKTAAERAEKLRGDRKLEREERASHYKQEADEQQTRVDDARKRADRWAAKSAALHARADTQAEAEEGAPPGDLAARDTAPDQGAGSGSGATDSAVKKEDVKKDDAKKDADKKKEATAKPQKDADAKKKEAEEKKKKEADQKKKETTDSKKQTAQGGTGTDKKDSDKKKADEKNKEDEKKKQKDSAAKIKEDAQKEDAANEELMSKMSLAEQIAFADTEAARLGQLADEEEKSLAELRKKQKEADESVDKVVQDEFALAFSYKLKKERQTVDLEFDFNKYRSAALDLRFDENIGDLHRFLDDDTVFRSVNLDDPMYKQREIAVSLDVSNHEEFKKYINYVTVQLRKKHENGEETIQDVRIDQENFSKRANDFRMLYGWKGDNDRAAWFDYQYRVVWSFFGGATVEGDWIKSTESTIPISSPFQRRFIELDGDAEELTDANVRAVAFTLYYKLAGVERAEQVTLKTSKGELNRKVELIFPPGPLDYDYEMLWMLKGNKSVSSGRQHSRLPSLSIDEVPEQSAEETGT